MTRQKFLMKQRLGCLALAVAVSMFAGVGVVRVAWGQNDEGPTSSLKFVVVREASGKPVKNAQVVLHTVNRKGKAAKNEIELKTDAEGLTSVDGIPYGSVEVQVLAPGFQTFGEDFEVKQPTTEITVKLKKPAGQYSIYDNHDEKKPDEKKPPK